MSNTDGIPRLEKMNEFHNWMFLMTSYFARVDLNQVIQADFHSPTIMHPSMTAPIFGAIPMAYVGQQLILAAAGPPIQVYQAAGMTQTTFDLLVADYNSKQSKVYGILMHAISKFTQLYDYLLKLPEVLAMITGRLLGSRIWTLISSYCTNNDSDTLAGVVAAQISTLRLSNFKSIADLIRVMNSHYHSLPPRLAHSDPMKKLQLELACGAKYQTYIEVHQEGKTFDVLCNALIVLDEKELAKLELSGKRSETSILKDKSIDEKSSETSLASVEENTRHNKETIGFRFNPKRSSSRSPQRSHYKNNRSRSPDGYSHSRGREYSRYSRDRSSSPARYAGQDRRVIRYANVNSQWRSGGSGYGGRSPSPARDNGAARGVDNQNRNPGAAVITCYSCGAPGHMANQCQNRTHGGPKCFNCGRPDHKVRECRAPGGGKH
jgi:hypothetical protein